MLPVRVVAQLPLLVQLPQARVQRQVVVVVLVVLVVLVPLLLPELPQVLVQLPRDVVARAQLLLLVQPQLLAQAPLEAAVAKEVHQLTRSF